MAKIGYISTNQDNFGNNYSKNGQNGKSFTPFYRKTGEMSASSLVATVRHAPFPAENPIIKLKSHYFRVTLGVYRLSGRMVCFHLHDLQSGESQFVTKRSQTWLDIYSLEGGQSL